MKNNNGFIATSLIYSFFLIFVSLFIAVITNYLQDKVLLETTVNNIKEGLNAFVDINTLEIGDMLVFLPSSADCIDEKYISPPLDKTYIVAAIDRRIISGVERRQIILYSYDLRNSHTGTKGSNLTKTNFENDMNISSTLNKTYVNRLLYSFDVSVCNGYSIDSNSFAYKEKNISDCNDNVNDIYENEKGCLKTRTDFLTNYACAAGEKYRTRYVIDLNGTPSGATPIDNINMCPNVPKELNMSDTKYLVQNFDTLINSYGI